MGKILISTRIETTAYEALARLAEKEDRTVSNLVRIAVKKLLEAREQTESQRSVDKEA